MKIESGSKPKPEIFFQDSIDKEPINMLDCLREGTQVAIRFISEIVLNTVLGSTRPQVLWERGREAALLNYEIIACHIRRPIQQYNWSFILN